MPHHPLQSGRRVTFSKRHTWNIFVFQFKIQKAFSFAVDSAYTCVSCLSHKTQQKLTTLRSFKITNETRNSIHYRYIYIYEQRRPPLFWGHITCQLPGSCPAPLPNIYSVKHLLIQSHNRIHTKYTLGPVVFPMRPKC